MFCLLLIRRLSLVACRSLSVPELVESLCKPSAGSKRSLSLSKCPVLNYAEAPPKIFKGPNHCFFVSALHSKPTLFAAFLLFLAKNAMSASLLNAFFLRSSYAKMYLRSITMSFHCIASTSIRSLSLSKCPALIMPSRKRNIQVPELN